MHLYITYRHMDTMRRSIYCWVWIRVIVCILPVTPEKTLRCPERFSLVAMAMLIASSTILSELQIKRMLWHSTYRCHTLRKSKHLPSEVFMFFKVQLCSPIKPSIKRPSWKRVSCDLIQNSRVMLKWILTLDLSWLNQAAPPFVL